MKPGSELRNMLTKLMDEIEIGVRTITTVSQEQIEQSMKKPQLLQQLPGLVKSANAFCAKFDRSLRLPPIQPRSDPLLFKRAYEDY